MSINTVASGANFTAVNIGKYADLHDFKQLNEDGTVKSSGKVFVKDQTHMTACEISFGNLPPHTICPIWHSHRKNEEEYVVLSGEGQFQVDDECFPIKEGTIVRVGAKGVRNINNSGEVPLVYMCIQAKENSLEETGFGDADLGEVEPKWK